MGGIVYALDAETGDFIWECEIGEEIWSAPAVNADALYIGTFDGNLYAIDANTGETKWQQPFETDGPIVSTPLVDSGVVYAASFDRHIYALDAATGDLLWQFPAEGEGDGSQPQRWFWASPLMYEDKIYAPNMDGNVYVIDAASGGLIAKVELGSAVSSAPVVASGRVFVATEEGDLFYIDTADNSRKELPPLDGKVTAPLTTDGSIVYIHSHDDETVYALDAATATTLWSVPISD
jgi:outer membrane protein assembly factor BamB